MCKRHYTSCFVNATDIGRQPGRVFASIHFIVVCAMHTCAFYYNGVDRLLCGGKCGRYLHANICMEMPLMRVHQVVYVCVYVKIEWKW